MRTTYLYSLLPKTLLLLVAVYALATAAPASAIVCQPGSDGTVNCQDETTVTADSGDFTYAKLVRIANELVKIGLQICELLAVGAIVYYGLRMVMSGGDSGKFNEAKKGLGLAILGAVVIFGVYTIIATIQGGVESVGTP